LCIFDLQLSGERVALYPFSATRKDRYNPRVTAAPIAAFDKALAAERYFEAHEILEAFWVDYRGADRDFYKGLIQAAVALHHRSRGNGAGAARVAARAITLLDPFAPTHAGVEVTPMIERLRAVAA
jgi:predicted metal-dependent hydrolase